MEKASSAPRASLSVLDGVAMMVGIVIGIGIFKTPSLVAANVGSEAGFLEAWILGGAITLVGALVYGEMAAAYPSTGGEYHFLKRAFGQRLGFLFAWARISVIQTGAIAAVAFVFGDYAQRIHSLGTFGAALYAGIALVALTLLNLVGTFHSKTAQNLFALLTVLTLATVAGTGLAATGTPAAAAPGPSPAGAGGALGLAMVFILLTYGGWNEAAYLSADVRDGRRNMVRILVLSTLVIVAAYLLINLAYLHVLGLQALRKSDAVAADMMRRTLGREGSVLLSATVCCAAISTLNATIFTGARIYHALGEDLVPFRKLGFWSGEGNNPRNAVLMQSAIAGSLIGFGAFTHDGFQAMVEYTAPVFWFFLLLVGISCFVLRRKETAEAQPFRTPFQLWKPVVFCLTCAYLLYSSLAYTGRGALVGIAVLLMGIPLLALLRRRQGNSRLIPTR
ncbi:MAG: APC family permease [Actinomycetota bacterium]